MFQVVRFNKYYLFFLIILLSAYSFNVIAQQDTIRPVVFSGVPGISSSPETGFRYGLVGQVSFDLYRNNLAARKSQLRLGIAGSSKGQFQMSSSMKLFGRDESYFASIWIEYQNWVDRHYGLGNDANMFVVEFYDEEESRDTINYLNYSITNFRVKSTYNRQITNSSFIGLYTEYFSSSNYSTLASDALIDPFEIEKSVLNGNYFGLGINYILDTRDDLNCAYTGQYLRVTLFNFNDALIGDFDFTKLNIEYRHFHNFSGENLLAFRFRNYYTFSDNLLPYDALNKLGGSQMSRGYFKGSFLDKHVMGLTAEYRFSPFSESNNSLWEFWRHFHAAVFLTASQSFGIDSKFNLSNFNYSAGGGIRIPITKKQRFSLRLDYAFGLTRGENDIELHRGFYVDINEAF